MYSYVGLGFGSDFPVPGPGLISCPFLQCYYLSISVEMRDKFKDFVNTLATIKVDEVGFVYIEQCYEKTCLWGIQLYTYHH